MRSLVRQLVLFRGAVGQSLAQLWLVSAVPGGDPPLRQLGSI